MTPSSEVGLREWAVHCDALARGEQIYLLRSMADTGGAQEDDRLPHDEFWLYPVWEGQRPADLTGPYRDRMRALEELRHGDGRVRIKYFATVEYLERIESVDRLLSLDGDHTLTARAVEDRVTREEGVLFLLLRAYQRQEAAVLEQAAVERPAPGWARLGEPVATRGLEPVVPDEAFLAEKTRVLRRTGSIRAV